MSADNNSFDEFFRQKHDAADAPVASEQHWNDMEKLLGPGPGPKKSVRKKTVRRVISYLGLIAIITTVTYFSVNRKKAVTPLPSTAKYIPQKTPLPQKQLVISPQLPAIGLVKLAIKPKRKAPVSQTIVRVISDTVFQQQPKALPKNISTTAIGPTGIAVRNFLESIKRPEQQFNIDPSRDTVLFGHEGTVVKIRAGSFVDSMSRAVKMPVTFKLTECYNYADMLAHDLTTTSGDAALVSGGMLRLQAFSENQELKLLSYKPILVAMPRENYDPSMQLFVPGSDAQSRANKNGQQPLHNPGNPEISNTASLDSIAFNIPADKIKSDSLFVAVNPVINWQPAGQLQGYQNSTPFFSRRYIKLLELRQPVKTMEQKENGHFIVSLNTNIHDDRIRTLLSNRYHIDQNKISFEKVASFDDKKKAKNTGVILTKTGFVAGDSIMMLFEVALKDKIVFEKDSLAFMKLIENDRAVYLERVRADSIAFVRQQEFDKAYKFDITGLGWINCDKFRRNDLERIEFTLDLPPGIDARFGNFKMVFKNQRSILPGTEYNGRISFGKVPLNEPVQLVCIAENNGKAIVCLKNIIISPAAIEKLSFEFMTSEEFKERLAKL